MSIELRSTGADVECDWGTFGNSEADPRYPIEHLMLTTPGYTQKLIDEGPQELRGGVHSATQHDGRLFTHLDYHGQHWTWELYDAHWWDGVECPVMVGRWPD